MKYRFLTALIAVIFMLFAVGPAAHAEPVDTDPPEIPSETPAPETPAPDIPAEPVTETSAPNPFTPNGTGTVMDYAEDGAGKVFYTITTPDDQVFYLVIDRERSAENVYFLNAVTVDDLMALAVPSEDDGSNGGVSAIPDTPVVSPAPEPIPSVEPSPEPAPQQGGGIGTPVLVIVLVIVGGGAGWYFKIYRPKQQRAASVEAEDYAPEDGDDWNGADPLDEEEESGGAE